MTMALVAERINDIKRRQENAQRVKVGPLELL